MANVAAFAGLLLSVTFSHLWVILGVSRTKRKVPSMREEDLINIRHDIDRHEGDLDRKLKQIQALEQQTSELKRENIELTISLKNVVILMRTIYEYLGTDKLSIKSTELRSQTHSHLNGLNTRLGIRWEP